MKTSESLQCYGASDLKIQDVEIQPALRDQSVKLSNAKALTAETDAYTRFGLNIIFKYESKFDVKRKT